jgi:TRAP-type mannitol/chloroaromatic compound transport system substrate-binding protein
MTIRSLGGRLGLAVTVAALAVAGAAPADAQERVRWRVPIAFPSSLPALGDNLQFVAEQLEMASGGNIEFRIAEPGELVPAAEISQSVRDGQVDAGYNWLGYDQGWLPASPLFSAVPFGMEPWAYQAWWYYGGGKELAEEIYGEHDVRPIFCGITGPETAGWFREPVEGIEGFEGLRIRFAGLGGRVLQQLGANVTMMPGGEIFQALERGVIDASEFALPVVDQRLGFNRVASYNYFPGWHQTFTAFHLQINTNTWDALDDQTKALIEMACMAGVTRNFAYGEAIQGEVIAGFDEVGVTATRLDEAILLELQAAADTVLAEEAAANEDFARVYNSQQAFRAEYALWRELAYLPRDWYSRTHGGEGAEEGDGAEESDGAEEGEAATQGGNE